MSQKLLQFTKKIGYELKRVGYRSLNIASAFIYKKDDIKYCHKVNSVHPHAPNRL